MGKAAEEIQVTRTVQSILILSANADLDRKFLTTRPVNPEVVRSLVRCAFEAEYVPVLGVLVISMEAKGKKFKDVMDVAPALRKEPEHTEFRTPDAMRKYVTVGSHQAAVLAAVASWDEWLSRCRTELGSHLAELQVKEVMEL